MANLVAWIEEIAEGQAIEGVVISDTRGWFDDIKLEQGNTLLTWDQAKPLLNYEFRDGYGSPECHAIYAWTKDWVIAISQYDGSTSPFRLPRHPVSCEPEMPGG